MTTTNFVSNLTDPARHQRSRACVGVRVGGGLIVVCIVVANSSRMCVPHALPPPLFFLVFQSCFLVFQVGVGVWGFV